VARTTRTTRPTRPVALAVGGLALAGLALTGCSPITTQEQYAASDGVAAQLGDQVKAGNLMIISEGEGEPGVLVGGLTNLTDEGTELTVRVGSESFGLPLGPRETLLLGTTTEVPGAAVEDVRISSVPAPPGAFTDLTLASMTAGEVTVGIPVLDGTLEPYDQLLP
jgi:hypothetical protein